MEKIKKIYYFASTHWDREWYKSINQFRFKLVPVIDKIIDTLESDEEFTKFTLDGQTSLLDDYLEIRPENATRLTALIKAGRLLIGPWYTMPDEFLVSYESLVQNLMLGHKTAEKYGAPAWKLGYVCDIFGHVANFPQVLKSFDINSALLSRGLNDEHIESLFNWQAPNGDSVTTFKAPEVCGYGSYYYECISPFYPNYEEHLDEIVNKSIDYITTERARSKTPYIILMDGMDHENIHPFAPKVAKRLSQHFGCPVELGDLSGICGELKDYNLPIHIGEINELGKKIVMHNMLITHTLSSRYDIKKANDECQNILEKYSMPLAAIGKATGVVNIAETYLAIAYSGLIENQAHDSICGCSIDAVHRDMHFRFNNTKTIASEVNNLYYEQIYRKSAESGQKDKYAVAVFNPLPYKYEGEISLSIDFLPEYCYKINTDIKYEQRNTFILSDKNDNELNYAISSAKRGTYVRNMDGNYNVAADSHNVSFVSELQPMSCTFFYVTPTRLPFRNMERLSTSPTSAENGLIRLEINSDGTITVTDLNTNLVYPNMHSFVDKSELGDGWFHMPAISEREISSIAASAVIEKTFDGFSKCVFRVTKFLPLPQCLEKIKGFNARSESYATLKIISEFTITRASKLVQVATTVYNNVLDHFFTLNIPTYTATDEYTVNQCNLFITRKCGLDKSTANWREADIGEKQFENIVYKKDNGKGLCFISKGGLHEVFATADKNSSLNITLFRAFSTTVATDGEPDGQLQTALKFEYAILPLNGESDAAISRIKDTFANKPSFFTIPTSKKCCDTPFLSIESENVNYDTMLCSSDKGAFVIRLTNYAKSQSSCTLNFSAAIADFTKITPLEKTLTDSSIIKNDNTVSLTLSPYETASYKFKL